MKSYWVLRAFEPHQPSHPVHCWKEVDGCLLFLDLLLIWGTDGSIMISVYRKPTATDKYLSLDSHHPVAHKWAVVRTLYGWADVVSSWGISKKQHIVKMLKKNEYLVKKACMTAPRVCSESSQEPLANISIPYMKGCLNLSDDSCLG